MRHRVMTVLMRSDFETDSSSVESQYLVGASSPLGHTVVDDWMETAYCRPSAVTPSRNSLSFPYAASAMTTPCGMPAATAFPICSSEICGFVWNTISSGTPAVLRRNGSSDHDLGK